MSQGRRIAAVILVAVTVSAAAAATAFALTTTVPTVTTPTATVPSVSTPVATTPSVTVPQTSTPKATTPSVTPPSAGKRPSVTTPKVTVPSTSTPKVTRPSGKSAPQVRTPEVTVPSTTVGGGGSSGSGRGPSGSGGGVVKGVTTIVPGLSAGGVAGAGSGSAAGTAASGYTTTGSGTTAVAPIFGGPGGPGGGGFAGPGGFTGFGPGSSAGGPGSPSVFAFGIPRGPGGPTGGVDAFTAAVASLAGCFYALTPFEQQVLIVRTGLDGREALTRTQLAALLGTTPGAIARSERAALGDLHQAARSDGCMPVAAAAFGTPLTAFVGGPFGPLGAVTPGIPPASRSLPATGGSQEPQFASSSFAERLATFEGGDPMDPLWAVLLIAILLLAAIAALGREVRHSVT